MNDSCTIANDILLGEVCSLLSEGKKEKLRPKGKSMRPFILKDWDHIILAPHDALRKGDIVLARLDEKYYVVRRIISIYQNIISNLLIKFTGRDFF